MHVFGKSSKTNARTRSLLVVLAPGGKTVSAYAWQPWTLYDGWVVSGATRLSMTSTFRQLEVSVRTMRVDNAGRGGKSRLLVVDAR